MSEYIKFQDVNFEYHQGHRRLQVFAGLNFSIAQNDFAVLVGPSGCGKTTALKLIAGLLRPTKGYVVVNGQIVQGPLAGISMMFQTPVLLPWRRVIDNVIFPYECSNPSRLPKQYVKKQAQELLEAVGLQGFEANYPWELSGGMQQRVALCRALVTNPKILLMDEPFGALDAFTREELWGVMHSIYISRQCTVVLVTHDIREAVFLGSVVAVLSPRPSTVIWQEFIPWGFPRDLSLTFTEQFQAVASRVRSYIKGAINAVNGQSTFLG